MLWLKKRIGTPYRPPFAVFFDLEWLQQHGYDLPNKLNEHPHLRYVPMIALTNQSANLHKKALVENGLDDCYTVPIPWEKLELRLEFLKQYKAQLLGFGDDLKGSIKAVQIPLYKRLFDILAASFGLIVTAPIWILVALAIKFESRGPVLYFSRRVGTGYKVFNFIKFRSMRHDAENHLDEYRHLNQYDGKSVFVKINDDPRITRVGRFIRNYSIDELPQLINVLRGDMSLVGNRPLPQYEAEQLTTDPWCARFLAPAGMTGKWQVTKSKRKDMTSEERIRLDVEYASMYSLTTDLGIIFSTFRALKQRENA
ncbi:MAG: sugar transferase [Saprospiraceae bacterium]|nr:sugar transferase [Saprospiraceae bacterium]